MIAFWILAPIMVLAALGILFVRKAVHAALLLALVMISLAVLYLVQGAPFLFAVQIIVYTGAILMLFLFVLMLVGVDASDSVVETIRGQRVMAIVGGLILGLVLVIGLAQTSLGAVTGLAQASAGQPAARRASSAMGSSLTDSAGRRRGRPGRAPCRAAGSTGSGRDARRRRGSRRRGPSTPGPARRPRPSR